jgi:dolichol-phosphate mannosyltransferase
LLIIGFLYLILCRTQLFFGEHVTRLLSEVRRQPLSHVHKIKSPLIDAACFQPVDSMPIDFASLCPPADWVLPCATVDELRPKSHDYCVLIPVLNEGQRIKDQLSYMQTLPDLPDVIVCDGGSSDRCTDTALMRELGVTCVIRQTGPGKMSASLRLLLAYALLRDYRGMVHMDGNNKDDPDFIQHYLDHIRQGYDCVAGSRFRPGGQSINTPLYRELAIRLIHAPLLSLAARRWLTDTTNSYRGYSPRLIKDPRINPFREVFVAYNLPFYLLVRASRLGLRVTEIPVCRRYPKGEVPSKILGIRANLNILFEVFELVRGAYNPTRGRLPRRDTI